jgi:beta-glucosidase
VTFVSYRDASLPAEQRAEFLLREMTLEEKIGQMCQYVAVAAPESVGNVDEDAGYELSLAEQARLIRGGRVGSFLKVPDHATANRLQELARTSRLGVPLLIATDAIHGHAMDAEGGTVFPSPIGLASSFDPALLHDVARVTAREMRATGFHWTFSPNLDVVRDARWGRCGETFGEDPLLASELGAAMVRGYQGPQLSNDDVLACAKHLVAGGISDNGLNGAPAEVSERTLHEVFFPPFIRAVECGVLSAMPAHNEVGGIPCHANRSLLSNLLRESWGFVGFVVSDWNDIARLHTTHRVARTRRDADRLAIEAGIDMHMHGGEFFENVKSLVETGDLSETRIDDAVRTILSIKFRLGLFDSPVPSEADAKASLGTPAHRALALDAARRSIVLLKNEGNLLPLNSAHRVLLTGPRADDQAVLGDWSRPADDVVTLRAGLERFAPVDYVPADGSDASELQRALEAARQADVVVLAVGENSLREHPARTSGENLDRATLELPGKQLELALALIETGRPVVLALVNGSPIASASFGPARAIIELWEPGAEGGAAFAEILFGATNPSGKLPITIPRSVGHLRSYYAERPSSHHRGRFFGAENEPWFAFGHGLSYSRFEYRELSLTRLPTRADLLRGERIQFEIVVENTSSITGEEVVLVYVRDLYASVTRPQRTLVAFRRLSFYGGERKRVNFELGWHSFSLLDAKLERVLEAGEFELTVAGLTTRFCID